MTVVQQLYYLLAIDVEIERFRKSIASIDDTLADNHLLLETQRSLEETQATLRTQETERKDLELTVEHALDAPDSGMIVELGPLTGPPRHHDDRVAQVGVAME